jgi:Na+-transporting methylmalonyl-CoA/oxaloacetate decarboxylase gamma subunit
MSAWQKTDMPALLMLLGIALVVLLLLLLLTALLMGWRVARRARMNGGRNEYEV